MAKKKRKKKKHNSPPKHLPNKKHNPTVMEMAFKIAEAKKQESLKNIMNDPHATTHDCMAAIKSKKGSSIDKIKTLTKKHNVSQKGTLNKINLNTSTGLKEKTSFNMGLQAQSKNTISLNLTAGVTKNRKNNKTKEKKIMDSIECQVHDGTFKEECDIVIGIDFGTSTSKVIIRDNGLKTAYAVPFDPFACQTNKYLIPAKIFVCEDGQVSLQNGPHQYTDLKVNLMDNPDRVVYKAKNTKIEITALDLATVYISRIITLSRTWFLEHTKSIYKNKHIYWHINIGIPSKNYDDIIMRNVFRKIAMAAWRTSRTNLQSILDIKQFLVDAENHLENGGKYIDTEDTDALWLHPDYINAHPEVIMEVVGYVHSPLRNNGLHLIVDIGATTLDVATFIIHIDEGENIFSLLETDIKRLGTLPLHNKRINTLKKAAEESLRQINTIDPVSDLPEPRNYILNLPEERILKSDKEFSDECVKVIGLTVKNTKMKRDPHSQVWHSKLPVFICGGGSRNKLHRDTINRLGKNLSNAWTGFNGFTIKYIPKPDELEAPDLAPQEYDRLAVAYGLSFTSSEIGKVIPESQIENIERNVTLNLDDKFISKDMC